MIARLQPREDRASFVELRVDRAPEQLDREHTHEHRGGRPSPPSGGEPVEERCRREEDRPDHRVPDEAPSRQERPSEERDRRGAEPGHGRARGERPVQEPLQARRGQDRQGEHGDVAETPGIVEVHVAERDREHERSEPGRAHEQGGSEHVGGEREPPDRDHERPEAASASREEDARERHGSRIGAGSGGETQRPGRPDAVGAERIAHLGLTRVPEHAVPPRRLDSPRKSTCGTRIGSAASGRTRRNSATRAVAARAATIPDRESATAPAAR